MITETEGYEDNYNRLDEQSFLSEIKQPRAVGEARAILCRNIDQGAPITVIGTPKGNLILYGCIYPIGIIKKSEQEDDKFNAIFCMHVPDVMRNDMLHYLKLHFPEYREDNQFLKTVLTDEDFSND